MPLAVLLNPDDPLFAFEHAMQHRAPMAIMSPLSRFSVLPYHIDPAVHLDVAAGPWHLNHQRAHNDFNGAIPPYYSYAPASPTAEFAFVQTQIVVEGNTRTTERWAWWTFVNHQEHHLINNAFLPIPNPGETPWAADRPVAYPFW